MFSVRRVLLTIALGTAIGAGPAVAAPAMANHNHNNNARNFAALMTGNGVVNDDADADGWGAVNIRVRPNGQVCYTVYVRRVADAENAKIYVGRRGQELGSFVASLNTNGNWGSGCTWVGKFVAWKIMDRPTRFAVQVEGDDGAIRGQLMRSGGNGNW
jgi:hypothetical protein